MAQRARACGLERVLLRALGPWRPPSAVHDPAKIVADLAIAVALGADRAADIAVARAQPEVFGVVASDPTVSRLIDRLADDADRALGAIRGTRAAARARVWAQAGTPRQAGLVVLDLDATPVTAHSEEEWAAKTWKKGFGFHHLLGLCGPW